MAVSRPREDIMANKSQGTWYVSFELPRGKRKRVRATKTFPNELDAKKFARAKLTETLNVSAGTLNPASAETDDRRNEDA